MPQVKDGPQELNSLLERIYANCMESKKDAQTCSMVAWSSAKDAGWYKGKDGKWHKRSIAKLLDEIEKSETTFTQSILLSKKKFKAFSDAVTWLKTRNRKYSDIDETEEYWRARQRNPKDFKPKTFRTLQIANGIKLIIGRLKK